MSLPVTREADTNNARPNLASQAPIDKIIIHRDAKGIIFSDKVRGTIRTSLRVIPSKARRDIRR
jgi:hypothetical protein